MAWKHRASARRHPRTACAIRIAINTAAIFQAFLEGKEPLRIWDAPRVIMECESPEEAKKLARTLNAWYGIKD